MNVKLAPATELAKTVKTTFSGASPEYEAARKALLADEIEFRRHMTRLGEQRRALPQGPVITKDYRFKDEQASEVGLKDLFGDKDTLVTYFWMYGPQRERPCPMCTNWLGSVNGNAADIKQRVATDMRAISADPAFRNRVISVGTAPRTGTPEEFAAEIKKDRAVAEQVVKAAGFEPQ